MALRTRVLVLFLAAAARPAVAAGPANGHVLGSKHDLSVTGPGTIRAVSERNACVFCHVPHGGSTNRPDPRAVHRPYESSTLHARPGTPTGASRICLSCHDGTIAVGETRTGKIATTISRIPADRPSNLGTDLRKTHPVSFRPIPGSGTHTPAAAAPVQLDRAGELQCTSCHDPHREYIDPKQGKFLVATTRHSTLCLACHDSVATGSHASSTAAVAPGGGDFGATVAEAGCMACHVSHGASEDGRLLRAEKTDDAACLRCHGASVARRNIGVDAAKPYAHAAQPGGVHDAAEGRPGSRQALPERSPGAPRHVTCVDCHDPHRATDHPAPEPGAASGALAGVWGIDASGRRVEQVRFEYEVCFKCHGDSANQPQGLGMRTSTRTIRRALADANLRRQLEPTARSAHPVVGPRRAVIVPSLAPTWAARTRIACTDCHASDSGPGAGGAGARGPHGSAYPSLLERSYVTTDYAVESAAAYALCYKCHQREVLLSDASSFPAHAKHLTGPKATPCSTCHASHGVSEQAGPPDEHAHLVDFDVSIVAAGATGQPARYRSLGPGRGSCTLTCHDTPHDDSLRAYGPAASTAALLRARRR